MVGEYPPAGVASGAGRGRGAGARSTRLKAWHGMDGCAIRCLLSTVSLAQSASSRLPSALKIELCKGPPLSKMVAQHLIYWSHADRIGAVWSCFNEKLHPLKKCLAIEFIARTDEAPSK